MEQEQTYTPEHYEADLRIVKKVEEHKIHALEPFDDLGMKIVYLPKGSKYFKVPFYFLGHLSREQRKTLSREEIRKIFEIQREIGFAFLERYVQAFNNIQRHGAPEDLGELEALINGASGEMVTHV